MIEVTTGTAELEGPVMLMTFKKLGQSFVIFYLLGDDKYILQSNILPKSLCIPAS